MFGSLGVSEIIVLAAIALVLLGPEKFPEFAKVVAKAYRDFRGYVDETKRELTKELNPVKKELRHLNKYKAEDYIDALMKDESEDKKAASEGTQAAPDKTVAATNQGKTGMKPASPVEASTAAVETEAASESADAPAKREEPPVGQEGAD
ncbi:MAG: twin-arginine translocase TatA/TatE family subunit [Candidatus Hydrogenedentes bacterium]|nr:twin-arginine translocase TatA/TatE family subunit [Candidatus Hydrogenedentota bacterium]